MPFNQTGQISRAIVAVAGKPFRLADYFSGLLEVTCSIQLSYGAVSAVIAVWKALRNAALCARCYVSASVFRDKAGTWKQAALSGRAARPLMPMCASAGGCARPRQIRRVMNTELGSST